jgi:WD40 repeat protein
VLDRETGEVIFETPGGEYSHLTRDGSRLLAASQRHIALWDITTGAELWNTGDLPASLNGVTFTVDESLVLAGAHDGTNRIWDAETGELIEELSGHRGVSWFGSMTADESMLASFSVDQTVRIWDLTPNAQGEIGGFDLPGFPVVQSGKIVDDQGAILQYADQPTAFGEPGAAIVFEAATGEIKRRFDGYGGQMVRLSPDGTVLAGQPFIAPGVLGPVHIRDVESGEVLVELEDVCTWDNDKPGPDCAGVSEAVGDSAWWMDFSPDGSMLAMGAVLGAVGVWDAESGQRLVWLPETAGSGTGASPWFDPTSGLLLVGTGELTVYETEGWSVVATLPLGFNLWDLVFTPEGDRLFGADTMAGIVTIDTATWEYLGDPLVSREGIVRDLAVNSDGTLLASGGADGFVNIWNADTGELIQAIPLGDTSVTLVEFLDDRHLLIIGQGLPPLAMTIDVDELTDIARSDLTRSFTEGECATYHFDPCPTLEDIKTGSA